MKRFERVKKPLAALIVGVVALSLGVCIFFYFKAIVDLIGAIL